MCFVFARLPDMCCALIAATRDMPHLLGAALGEFVAAPALSVGHPDPSGHVGPVVLVVDMSIRCARHAFLNQKKQI